MPGYQSRVARNLLRFRPKRYKISSNDGSPGAEAKSEPPRQVAKQTEHKPEDNDFVPQPTSACTRHLISLKVLFRISFKERPKPLPHFQTSIFFCGSNQQHRTYCDGQSRPPCKKVFRNKVALPPIKTAMWFRGINKTLSYLATCLRCLRPTLCLS